MPPEGPPIATVLVVFACVFAAILGELSAFSRLVRIERERHPETWEADGRPAGPWTVPWRLPPPGDPSRPRNQSELRSANRVHLRWLIVTPPWARDDEAARRLLWRMRGLQLVGLVAVACWLALALGLSAPQ